MGNRSHLITGVTGVRGSAGNMLCCPGRNRVRVRYMDLVVKLNLTSYYLYIPSFGMQIHSVQWFMVCGIHRMYCFHLYQLLQHDCRNSQVIVLRIPCSVVNILWYASYDLNLFFFRSMAAYTIERYIAVCRPLLARKVCTPERTRRIIGCCWLAAALYCSPWFAMAQTHSDEDIPELVQCQISVPASVYSIVFGTDLLLFYIVPLLIAVFAYWNIGRVMRRLPDSTPHDPGASGRSQVSVSSETSIRRKSASSRCFARRNHSGERVRAGESGPRSIALISRTSIQSGITAQSTRPLSRRSVSQVRVIQT